MTGVSNPFVPPVYRPTPRAPLRPLDFDPAEYDRWFLRVGGHRNCADKFEEQLEMHCESLDREHRAEPPSLVCGQLVIVEGPENSGKRTLVEHLVDAARRALEDRRLVLRTVDLRYAAGRPMTVPALDLEICRGIRRVLPDMVESAGEIPELPESNDAGEPFDPAPFLHAVGRRLAQQKDGPNIAVLLPRSPVGLVDAHPDGYGLRVRPGMLFFGERLTEPTPAQRPKEQQAADRFPTQVYRLRALESAEIRVVIESRLGQRKPTEQCPAVSEDVMNQLGLVNVNANGNTLGWIIDTMRGIYDRRINGTSGHSGLEVTFEEVLDHLEQSAQNVYGADDDQA